ncbi:bifunctional demethylmenaquinone methyltransferase/2-methoxy-6-polyprenyl-1,4-benzoquinol methylase UbiE [Cesiribacter andamanensis]|uniref:Demethylmenaquinone methyltransferase n=1 Tax=Cesiribacter andamanensis AMV16 TaxID=1279009 RepID=M7NYZ8_9BACT|nr:bifunctional demethylmenaquinone methyltransferase/2-methoxy-6-polyprenyl-1,4-benzoquinol methylase UbiE [Cesiribacter andamanensis]EMR03594.1 Demethylmenaquinone methyltransferase [Cesiribacter andamanensis AMV16]
MTVLPYKDQNKGKKEQVANMFDNISPRYDLLNHLLSLGIDVLWRKKAIRLLRKRQPRPDHILDVATGTGDFALEALSLKPRKITGIDISAGMLEVGRQKMLKRGLADKIEMKQADSENLPFEDNMFDAVIVAFGVRNFEDLKKGLKEMNRVMKPGAAVAILEFSRPRSFPFQQIYNFYFQQVLPRVGRLISKDSSAYTYLPESVQAFPDGRDFLKILEETGYKNTAWKPLTFGISAIYLASK